LFCSPGPSGFTLTKLLVVNGVIGNLTALLLPALSATKSKRRDVQAESNLRQLALAGLIQLRQLLTFLPQAEFAHTTKSLFENDH
jgi:type II secretory pathway pseudopilin PulG